jgi:hypothetical protein
MAKHHHAERTRQLLQPFIEQQSRNHRAIVEFAKLGKEPKVWPSRLVRNPLEAELIMQAIHRVPQCGCLKLSCKFCGFVAFHARVRSVERPYLNTTQP